MPGAGLGEPFPLLATVEPAGPRSSWGGSGKAGRRRGRVGFCGHTMRILPPLSILPLGLLPGGGGRGGLRVRQDTCHALAIWTTKVDRFAPISRFFLLSLCFGGKNLQLRNKGWASQ